MRLGYAKAKIAGLKWDVVRTRHASIYFIPGDGEAPQSFVRRVDLAVEQVSAYLGIDPPAELKIRLISRPAISVTYFDTSTIVISRRRLPNATAVVHEVTHAVAGPGRPPRPLLVEGLAVFLQEKFGGADDRSFPAEGRDLHQETALRMRECKRSMPLTDPDYLRNCGDQAALRRLAYLQAGSFIRFLAERHGIAPVLSVYGGKARWLEQFGVALDGLERQWLDELALPAPQP